MTKSEWSLRSELLAATQTDTVERALRRLGLPSVEPELIPKSRGWYRAGSETYLYQFTVRSQFCSVALVLKACVAVGSLDGVDNELDQWIARRLLLSSHSVATPSLLYRHRACVLEEFIERSLADCLVSATAPIRDRLLAELGRTAAILGSLGFVPKSLSDLRSRGEDVVVVDFGEDLGPPCGENATAALDCVLELLSEAGGSDRDVVTLSEGFELYASA